MPYASAADAPSYVPKAKRAQWVAVWNSAHAKAIKDGKDAKGAEQSAFAQANGAVKKESAVMFEHLLAFGSIARVVEAHLPMNTSHDALRSHLRDALTKAHYPNGKANDYSWSSGPWVSDVFPGHVVYQHDNQTYSRSYKAAYGAKGTDPAITLGSPKAVHRAYVGTTIAKMDEAEAVFIPAPDGESVTVTHESLEGTTAVHESIDFCEEVKVKEGLASSIPIKIIGPGWGSMAYYGKEMLKRDGPKVYTKGTHMYWNHSTEAEEAQRPEGDLNNLAAVLTEDASWKDAGPKGPGLYSKAKVFSDYATQVAEKGGHIGISINAAIKGKEGTVEGRTGRIAEQLVHAFSADFVTKAGAGGAPVVPVHESARGQQEQHTMTPEEVKEREDLKKENDLLKARLATVEESQNQVLAIATVSAILREAKVPFSQPLLERVCLKPTMKEGKIDPEWVKAAVKDLSHGHEGHIEHFGEGETRESIPEPTEKRLKEALKSLGVPEKGLDYAVAGRA